MTTPFHRSASRKRRPTSESGLVPEDSWRKLPKGPVRTGLDRWSMKWNLNADWCRDHALSVLLRFFFHKGLQDSFLHPHDPNLNPFLHPPKAQTLLWQDGKDPIPGEPNNWPARIWASVADEALRDDWERERRWEPGQPSVSVSRDILRWLIFERHEPEPFVLKGEQFSVEGWNFLDDSLAEFQRRVELHFLEYLATLERQRLAAFREDLNSRRLVVLRVRFQRPGHECSISKNCFFSSHEVGCRASGSQSQAGVV